MKNRIATLILLLFAVQLSFAQVKRQYQDEIFSQTTVVVKDDQAQDADILDQFDLDDIGMDQVIRITTDPTKSAVPEPAVPAQSPEVVETKPTIEVAPEDRKPKARRWAKREPKVVSTKKVAEEPVVAKVKKAVEKTEVNRGGKSNERKVQSKKNFRRSSKSKTTRAKKKRKRKNRRLKRSKRKKFKGKKYSCFSF